MLSLKKKGLVASVATLAMAVGGLGLGASVANAAAFDKDSANTVTVTLPKDKDGNDVTGYTYHVYEVGKYIGADQCDVTGGSVAVQATKNASAAFGAAATKAGVSLDGDDKVAAAAQLDSYGSDIRKIASDIDASDLTEVADSDVVADGGFTGDEAGWYLITATNDETGKPAVASLVGTKCTAIKATGAVELKNPNGNLPGDTTDQNPTKSMVGSVVAGGTVEFTLSANIPDYTDMKDVEYKLFDYPAAELTPDTADAVVKVNGTALTEGTDYTITDGVDSSMTQTGEDKSGKNFTVDLSAYVAAHPSEKGALTVTYTATVDSLPKNLDSLNTFDVDNNGVRVPEGPSDPNPNDPGNDTPDPSDGDVQFTKVDEKGDKLDGAVFTLTSDTDSKITATATSTDGVVKFENLGAGDYTIAETKAPTGYMTSGSTFKVNVSVNKAADGKAATVTAELSEKSDDVNVITLAADGKNAAGVVTKDDATLVQFENVKNLAQLPLTGAAGIVLFVVIATLLAGGSVAMVQVSKRNKKAGLAL